ncbi:glycosyltransferase [uncultured Clostridium sp.]|uniref:glycosyltransferase n=1 Tax=uncultured Clostridium sp. TaxID=59620 RepID=UPI002600E794|nr:glycosyltransferase [uncultured Clostridium sp.]
MNVKISVIVPVYNNEKYLERCINSLIKQTLKEIEIILINDCSTDGSLNILKEYEKKYSDKIVVISHKEKKGPGGSRNTGIDMAHGEYIGFVDSDDEVSCDMFEYLYKIAKRANYDLVDCKFFDEYLKKNTLTTDKRSLGVLNSEKRKLFIVNPGYVWSKIIKKSILNDNNIRFREKIAYEDFDFMPIVILFCNKICATSKVLYNYRYNNKSITNNYKSNVHVDEKLEAMKKLVERFKQLKMYDEYRDEITYLIYETYSNMIQAILVLEKKADLKLFKKLHDVFLEVVDYDYHDNKYIAQLDKKDRLFAEINNKDYTLILKNCSDLLNNTI